VAAYIDGHRDQVDTDGRELVVRNESHAALEVRTAVGGGAGWERRASTTNAPDPLTGERSRFSRTILPAWSWKSRWSWRCCRCCICTACGRRTSPRVGALPWLGCRPAGVDRPAHHAVAKRSSRDSSKVASGHRLPVQMGGRHPRDGSPRAGLGVPAGNNLNPHQRPQGLIGSASQPTREPTSCPAAADAASPPRPGRWRWGSRVLESGP
jgi:hypothetical protein